jgi:hypothetical protein
MTWHLPIDKGSWGGGVWNLPCPFESQNGLKVKILVELWLLTPPALKNAGDMPVIDIIISFGNQLILMEI